MCISNELLGDADSAGPWITLLVSLSEGVSGKSVVKSELSSEEVTPMSVNINLCL
jgi:hypothetical protein